MPINQTSEIRSAGVIGAGLMGAAIAGEYASNGIPVKLFDTNQEAIERAVDSISGPIYAAANLEELFETDLVIEAVAESPGVKRKLFKKLEAALPATTLIASNTSSISISQLGSRFQHPERFCGLHFCHPVRERKLVEVVRGVKTSQQTLDIAVAHLRKLNKLPIVVQDCPGFVVNRILTLYLNETLALLQQGIPADQIEHVMLQFGMPIGPVQAFDAIGIDIALRVGAQMQAAYPDRLTSSSSLLLEMFRAGYAGEKNRKGFYLYTHEGERQQSLDPQVQQMIDQAITKPISLTQEEITDRLMLPWVLEATRLLEEKIISSPQEIDLALVHGLGFPEEKRGILAWADEVGAMQILDRLKSFEPLGEQFKPTEYLTQRASSGIPLIECGI